MNKYQAARILHTIGILLEIKGESFFKSRAYYEAARTLEMLDEDLYTLVKEKKLEEIKGFGEALVSKITELVTTGRLDYYEKLLESVPSGLLEMMRIPGLGAKKVKAIYEALGITTVEELRNACLRNRIAGLKNFGAKTQDNILQGINNMDSSAGQFLYVRAEEIAASLLDRLLKSGLAQRLAVAGSLRRKKEIVKDVDILASSAASDSLMEVFIQHPLVERVVSSGATKTSVVLSNGMNADLRVVSDEEFPFALHHFTGSREHNTAMRHIARQSGIKMNEYGLFREDTPIECKSEEEIFRFFSMQYIPPELRENNGELEAAIDGKLPDLITDNDIIGVLHIHTDYSDGSDTIADLAAYCISKGYSYMGVSDHSRSAHYAGGLSVDDLNRQLEEIERLNERLKPFRILKGIEVDILPDGSLDYEDKVLESFDFIIASVHSSFRMEEDKMTRRIIKALENKHVSILGHPTGRLLLSREPYHADMNEVINAAAQNGIAIEINANPHRLDLDWRYCRQAKEQGCKFAICPDAHRVGEIDEIRFGVNIARKGWLEREDIINTKKLSGIIDYFSSKT